MDVEHNFPPLPDNKNKRGKAVGPEPGRIRRFTIVDEVVQVQTDAPHKAVYLQRLQFEDGSIRLRLGYYIIGKKPRMLGKWVWGQFAAEMLEADFVELMGKAKEKGRL